MNPVDRLRVIYELDDQRYRDGMRRMQQASRRTSDDIIAQAQRAERGMASLGRIFAGVFSAAAISRGIKGYTSLADAATQMSNSLRVAGLEGEELSRVYDQIFRSAQRNSAPVTSLVQLYSRLAIAQDQLGVSSDDLIKFTDGVSVALRVAGTDATAASGALLQLSQALGGGVVRAEEFNSMLEGAPTIVRAVARGLKEANGNVSELRSLVNDGRVSSTAFFRAFQVGSEELRQQAETSQSTVGQAFTRMGNSILRVVGEFDKSTGATEKFANQIGELGEGLDRLDVEGFVSNIKTITSALEEAEKAATGFLNEIGNAQIFADLNEFLGYSENGIPLTIETIEAEKKIAALEKEEAALAAQIENNKVLGFDNTEALARLDEVRGSLASLRAEMAALPRHESGAGSGVIQLPKLPPMLPMPQIVKEQVSIDEYPTTPPGGSGGGSGSGRGRSGGKGRGRDDRPFFEDVERDLQNLEREIALIGKSTQEVARARAEWAMLDEAKKRGIPVNEALNAQIAAQADEVGRLTAELEAGELAHQKFEQAVDGIADAMAGALVAGESLRDGLAQVFKQIAADLMRSGIHDMLSGLIPGGGGKRSGGLLSWLGFAQGGYTGHGGRHEPAGVVHRGEYVMDADTVRRAGGPAAFDALRAGLRGPGHAIGGPAGAPAMPRLPSIPAAMGRAAAAQGSVDIVLHAPEGFTAQQMQQIEGVSVKVVTQGMSAASRRSADQQYLSGAR